MCIPAESDLVIQGAENPEVPQETGLGRLPYSGFR